MNYFEVWVADSRFRADKALTYSHDGDLSIGAVVTVPLRSKMTTAFVAGQTTKPAFEAKPIKNVISTSPLPAHSLELARWTSEYYGTSLGETLRQFAPVKPSVRKLKAESLKLKEMPVPKLELDAKLTKDQIAAITDILAKPAGTVLLHGETGSGKTRVYLELIKNTLAGGKSAIILTPEISLLRQLEAALTAYLHAKTFVLHSQQSDSERKKSWLQILESKQPVVVLGPRSALFAPVGNPGLVVLDEAHEPAYKQDNSPRYSALRVAGKLGVLANAKVVLGTATPSVVDYYLASVRSQIIRMQEPAIANKVKTETLLVDIKNRDNFSRSAYLSNQLIDAISAALAGGKQAMVYLNRRGSARVILCGKCGWQLVCPNCDIPLVYHADKHRALCHTCGYSVVPPMACPDCANNDIIYKSIGTKALTDILASIFPSHRVQRFDSDSDGDETVNANWADIVSGKIDILVGTQLLAKGLDLPRLAVVGVVTAESSLSLPDYTAEERTFQLLYQVMGRVGRGHTAGTIVIQSYQPDSPLITAAVARDYESFYKFVSAERQKFRFPPYAYLLKLTVRKAGSKTAELAAQRLKTKLLAEKLPVEIIGPAPSFFGKRGSNYYWQIVVKSKDRKHLVSLAKLAPTDWSIDLDPGDLL